MTVCCATDGNHGRAVAWGARTYGCSANIFVHANVTKDRIQAMERFGANVVQIEGNYDESVRYAAEQASANGWIVVWTPLTRVTPRSLVMSCTVTPSWSLSYWNN